MSKTAIREHNINIQISRGKNDLKVQIATFIFLICLVLRAAQYEESMQYAIMFLNVVINCYLL